MMRRVAERNVSELSACDCAAARAATVTLDASECSEADLGVGGSILADAWPPSLPGRCCTRGKIGMSPAATSGSRETDRDCCNSVKQTKASLLHAGLQLSKWR